MVMSEQHPLDAINPYFVQMLEGSTVAQIDQESRIAVANEVAVAGIGEGKEIG